MRYRKDMHKIPSKADIDKGEELSKLGYDPTDKIDFENLKSSIHKNGPILAAIPDLKIKFTLDITPCGLCEELCGNDVIVLRLESGMTCLTTIICKE